MAGCAGRQCGGAVAVLGAEKRATHLAQVHHLASICVVQLGFIQPCTAQHSTAQRKEHTR